MSRIGKNPIEIPSSTEVDISDGVIKVRGPKGELSRPLHGDVVVEVKDGAVHVAPASDHPRALALWGTFASIIRSLIAGVNEHFEKRLVVEGIGYRVSADASNVTLSVGYSHPVTVAIPDDVSVAVDKNIVTVSGADKERVGQFAANVRAVKKPEPYKGKGIRYEDEIIRRKQGKKGAA